MQPDTIDFTFIDDGRFKRYLADRPYIKIGTEFVARKFVVAYTKPQYMDGIFTELGEDYLTIFPQLLSPLSIPTNSAAGITQAQRQPYLNLTGRGVLMGFVDTGIDYTQRTFRYEDGTSKIKYIWDQTIASSPPENIRFGSVYSQELINEALRSEDPSKIVPSMDNDGHGTFLASVAAGRESNEFIGAAPDSEIIAVKLKQASPHHLRRFNFAEGTTLYSSADFMLGIKFVLDMAGRLNMPVVICIGMGTNFCGHDGNTMLEEYISSITSLVGIVCVAGAGNESSARRHTMGQISQTGNTATISINVESNVESFPFYISNQSFDKISVEVISPIGETTSRLPVNYGYVYSKKLILEPSTVTVRYFKDKSNVIIIDIAKPTQGLWNVVLHGDTILSGRYHAWLPLSSIIRANIEFLRPSPDYTIVIPATALRVITCGAYDHVRNSLFVSSSWGPTKGYRMAPDFVAPGVNVQGVYPTGYGTMTGTSVAAAVTAGACALLLQWGIIRGKEPAMTLDRVKSLLISGCIRQENITYPNTQWGFGMLNLFNVFEFLRET